LLLIRRDGRVGRRRSPAKRVYWETGIEGSNPSLSATILSDTALISARIVNLFIYVFISVFVLGVCQGHTEIPPDSLQSSASHVTAREKTIVVPPEVLRRWRAIRLAVIDKTRGTENIYVVPIGSLFKLPSSSLTIIVEAFLPSFIMEGMTITTASNEPLNPGAKVRISDNGAPVFQGWLFSKFPNTHAVTHPKFGFSLIGAVPVSR
jgi:Uncharacterized protein conserved in bacteria (DUF2155)